MSSSSPSTPTNSSRLWIQPVLYMVTGVCAAYALIYARRNYANRHKRKGSARLRRRGAVRRQHRSDSSRNAATGSSGSDNIGPVVQGLVRALEATADVDRPRYGYFNLAAGRAAFFDSFRSPERVPSIELLMRYLRVDSTEATTTRRILERTYTESFLAIELGSPQTLFREPGDFHYLLNAFVVRGFNEQNIAVLLRAFNDEPMVREAVFSGDHSSAYGTSRVTIDIHPPIQQETLDASFRRSMSSLRPRNTSQARGRSTSRHPAAPPPRPSQQFASPSPPDHTRSDFSWRDDYEEQANGDSQNLLNVLYHIADDQAKKDGYVHRRVTCNSCGTVPIQGIRYRCANCVDYDLCEACEALQVHTKTHLFYKIRVPAPSMANARNVQPVIYPGRPELMPRNLPRALFKRLLSETGFEDCELMALWDQFRCIASTEWLEDPNHLCMAVDRATFARCFIPSMSAAPPAPNLVHDRAFAFYDTNKDGLIGFEEFAKALASLTNNGYNERLKRLFDAYDLDGDGYVERRDFLRVFRAYYTLTKETTKEVLTSFEDDFFGGGPRDIILGSQPISSAFPVSIDPTDVNSRQIHSRLGEGKARTPHGDLEIVDGEGIFRRDDNITADRDEIISNTAMRRAYDNAEAMRRLRMLLAPRAGDAGVESDDGDFDDAFLLEDDEDDDLTYPSFFSLFPADLMVEKKDIIDALGSYVPLEEITDPIDRARIKYNVLLRMNEVDRRGLAGVQDDVVRERWERRAFYTDEEDGYTPPDEWVNTSEDSAEDEVESNMIPPSPRSRSSSKVRFQDDVTDNGYETYDTRSNASSRSIPVAERWGGFGIPEIERDAGKEVLYQITQEGINELLDGLFKEKEDLVVEAQRSRPMRAFMAKEINAFVDSLPEGHELKGDGKFLTEKEQDHVEVTHQPPPRPLEPNQGGPDIRGPPMSEFAQEGPTTPSNPSVDLTRNNRRAASSWSSTGHGRDSFDRPDPTLPQNRPNTPDLEDPFITTSPEPIAENLNTRIPARPRPPLTHQNAEGSLSLGRVVSPDDYTMGTIASGPIAASILRSILPPAISPFNPLPGRDSTYVETVPRDELLTGLRQREGRAGARSMEPTSPLDRNIQGASQTWRRNPLYEGLARLNQVEREAERRGGNGARLNFEEFKVLMERAPEKHLEFMITWIDSMAF